MLDGYTSSILLVCSVEVKHQGGDANGAVAQLAIRTAAGLRHLRGIIAIPTPSLLPFLDWTVIGHQWDLYVIWMNTDAEMVVLGPSMFGTMFTIGDYNEADEV